MADDFDSRRRASSSRRSPFQGVPTTGSSSPYRFPKIQPLPNIADMTFEDDDDPDLSQGDVIQVEEEPERFAATIRTAASDSGNDAGRLTSDEEDVEEKKTRSTKWHSTEIRSRTRRDSLRRRGNSLGSVSSLLVDPGRKLHQPLRTRIVRILCWQLLLSMVVCLPFLLIADFSECLLSHFHFAFRGIWLVYVSSVSSFGFDPALTFFKNL